LVVFTLILLCLGQIAMAQGVISLPWTGQEKCYNSTGVEIPCAGTGQDGDVQAGIDWPSPRFTVSGDCVTDNLTGLMWAKNANLPNKPKDWQAALDYVASINTGSGLCGHQDWHLPNINELESLVNAGEANTATWLISQGFSNVKSDYYWSSTSLTGGNSSYAWPVDMWSGAMQWHAGSTCNHSKSNFYYIWPVREDTAADEAPAWLWKTGQKTKYSTGDDGDLEKGIAWPSPRFIDHGNGTVTDNLTGLMWTKNASLGGVTTWQEALDYVKTLDTGKHSDWRLPNRKELLSLIDRQAFQPTLPDEAKGIFQYLQSVGGYGPYYWTSTTTASNTSNAWVFCSQCFGLHEEFSKSSNFFYLWPVRSAQAPSTDPVISVTPNPVDFGTVNVGATLDKSITVKNAGNADLVIGTITLPSSPFSILTDDCSSQTLSPGETCTVIYRFSPTSEGSSSSSSDIPSNDTARNPLTVTLNGLTAEACAYTISPANKTFNARGGSVSIKVSATGQTNCPAPLINEDAEWISVSGTPTWKGNKGTIKIAVQKNPGSQSRTGIVSIGGQNLTIQEDGAICQLTALKPSSGKYPNTGGSGSFDITVSPQDCGWNVATTFDWIHLDTTTGTGNGTAAFHIDANGTGKNRTGKIDVSLAQDAMKKKTFSTNQSK